MSTLAKLVVELGLDSSQFSSGIANAQKQASGLGSVLQSAAGTALGFATAMIGTRVIGGAFDMIKDSVIGMNATLETSTLQFTTLMGSADKAEQHIKALFDLAAATPFESQSLINASQNLQVFGGSMLNTIDTMKMFGDAAAATARAGVPMSSQLEQLTFWSGRMYAALQAGKPLGHTVLEMQRLGVVTPQTVNAIEASVKAGNSASATWKIFTDDLHRFTGAMAAQSQTWTGLTSTVSDNSRMLIAVAFKPLFDEGKKALTGLINLFNQLAASGAAQRFADGLQFVIAVLERFGSQVIGYAKAAYSWGQNIAQQFAAGIAAAVNVVVGILQQLGSIIAHWLQPGSPPRIVPNLDEWGAQAGTVYIEGWANADFSAFEDLSRSIESTLKGLVDTKQFDQRGVIPTLLAGREGLAAGLSEIAKVGQVSQATFDRIIASVGPAAAAVSPLIRAYFDLSAATQRQRAAQDDLNRTTQKYSDMLAPLNAQMKALQDQAQHIRNLQRIDELNKVLADSESSQLDKDLAANELQQIALQENIDGIENERDAAVAAAQAKVDAADKEVASAKERVDQQKALIDNTNTTNQLIGEQARLLEQLAKAAESGGKGKGGPNLASMMPTIASPGDMISSTAAQAQAKIDEINAKADAFVTGIQTKITTIATTIQTALQPIVDLGQKALPVLAGIAAGLATFSVLTNVVGWVMAVATAWGTLTAAIGGSTTIIGGIVALLGGPITVAIAAIALAIGVFAAAWAGNWGNIRETFAGVVSAITPLWETLQAKIGTAVQNLIPVWDALQVTIGKLAPVFAVVGGVIVTVAEAIIGFIGGTLPGVFFAAAGIIQAFLGVVNLIADVVSGVVTLVVQLLTGDFAGAWNTIKTLVSNIVVDILQVVGGLLQGIFGIIGGLVGGVIEFFKTLYNVIVGHSIIPEMVAAIITTIATLPNEVLRIIGGLVTDAITKLNEFKDSALKAAESIGKSIVDGIQSGIASLWGRFTQWIQDRINEIPQVVRDVLGISSPSKVFAQLGMNTVQGFLNAFNSSWGSVVSSASEKTKQLVADMASNLAGIGRGVLNALKTIQSLSQGVDTSATDQAEKRGQELATQWSEVSGQLDAVNKEIARVQAEQVYGDDATELKQKKLIELYNQQNDLLGQQQQLEKQRAVAATDYELAQRRQEEKQNALNKIAEDAAKQYNDLQTQVATLAQTDSNAALALYKAQSARIAEMADLKKQLALATDQTTIDNLTAQIALLEQVQGLESNADQAVAQVNVDARGSFGIEDFAKMIEDALAKAGINIDIRTQTA